MTWHRIASFVLPVILATASAAHSDLVVVRNVNLRPQPSSSVPVIRLLEPPERLVRTESEPRNNYFEVVTEFDETGWVWRRNVAPAGPLGGVNTATASGAGSDEVGRITDNCPNGAPLQDPAVEFGETSTIARDGYALQHSSDLKIALWVCEHVTVEELTGEAVRKNRFRPDPLLAQRQRSELADYSGSGYDRGHIAPAGNQVQRQRLKDETFFLSNMAPQVPAFNRQIWRELESKSRGWASAREGAHVVSGPIFYDAEEDDPATADGFIDYFIIGEGEVAVPTHFYKIVVASNAQGTVEAIAFILENRSYSRPYDFAGNIQSIDRIEELTDLDFMPDLSAAEEARLEQNPAAMW